MKNLDAIIVSYAKDQECYDLTYNCLKTLFESENEVDIKAIVVESQDGIDWFKEMCGSKNIETLKAPLPYGYHKFLNFGRKHGTSEYVALCNNDLVFHKNWASKIIDFGEANPEFMSFSPICPQTQPKMGIGINTGVYAGLVIRATVSGWCIVQKRKIYDVIGDLDERYTHWYSDNDYAMTLVSKGLNHFLVTDSIVEHHHRMLGRTTEIVIDDKEFLDKMTFGEEKTFRDKWNLK
jgi:GT2 family glycosyltransferase